MHYGGAFLTSKYKVLKHLDKSNLPTTVLVQPKTSFSDIEQLLIENKIAYPLIVKPDKGERGKGVEKINTSKDLRLHHKRFEQITFLIQEYIDYTIELGILFFWDKNDKPIISSVTQKSFCSITGNGTDCFGTLVQQKERIQHRIKIIRKRFEKQWNTIPSDGEKILLEPIGNHNKGTMFLDARHMLSTEMLHWTKSCAEKVPGFDYGRFDIKIKQWNAFSSTNKNDIKIMEVNGVNSEPCHIYDPSYTLIKTYKDIFYHMRIIYELSKQKKRAKDRLMPFLKTGCKVALNKIPYA